MHAHAHTRTHTHTHAHTRTHTRAHTVTRTRTHAHTTNTTTYRSTVRVDRALLRARDATCCVWCGRYASAQIAFEAEVSRHDGDPMSNARLMLNGDSDQKSYACGPTPSILSTPANACPQGSVFGAGDDRCFCTSGCAGATCVNRPDYGSYYFKDTNGEACTNCKCLAKADTLADTTITPLKAWDANAVTCFDEQRPAGRATCGDLRSFGWCGDGHKYADDTRAECPVACGTCPPKPTSAPFHPVAETIIVALNRGGTRAGDVLTYTMSCTTPPCTGVAARLSVVYGKDPHTDAYNASVVGTVPLPFGQQGAWRTIATPLDGDYTLELINGGAVEASVTWALVFRKQQCYESVGDFLDVAARTYASNGDRTFHAFLVDDRNYLPYLDGSGNVKTSDKLGAAVFPWEEKDTQGCSEFRASAMKARRKPGDGYSLEFASIIPHELGHNLGLCVAPFT